MQYYRHGDVHVIKIDVLPEDLEVQEDNALEYGEVTGHAHRIYSENATIFKTKSGQRYLRVVSPADLRHEEHETRVIPPGIYEIRRTLETDHMSKVSRMVAD